MLRVTRTILWWPHFPPFGLFEERNFGMEPIGAAASILTFIQATAVLTRTIQTIYRRWRHSPEELQGLSALLLSLGAELDIIQCTATAGHPLRVDAASQNILTELLRDARVCVEEFEAVLTRVQEYGNIRQRVMWATHESRKMDMVIVRLRAVEDRLSRWLQVLSWHVTRNFPSTTSRHVLIELAGRANV
jgi:hypothetical protein